METRARLASARTANMHESGSLMGKSQKVCMLFWGMQAPKRCAGLRACGMHERAV